MLNPTQRSGEEEVNQQESLQINKTITVQQKQEIENKIQSSSHELYYNSFVYRVLAFTTNGTLIVDLKLQRDSKEKETMTSLMNKSTMQFACKLNAEKLIPILTQAVIQKKKEWHMPTDKEKEVMESQGDQSPISGKKPNFLSTGGTKHLRDSHIKFQGDVTTLTAGLKSQSRIGSRIEDQLQQASQSINEEAAEKVDQKGAEGQILNETMQDLIEIQLFNLNIAIVFNDLFCVATLSNIQSPA